MIEFNHNHNYVYGDVPGLGECKCGAYRVWNKENQTYGEYEGEGAKMRIECAYNEHGACKYNGRIRGSNDCSCSCHEREGK